MLKNKPIYIFAAVLIAVVIIAISIVVSVYNNNKPVVPDRDIEVLSSNDMVKIKKAYETEGKKQEFLELCESIELAVANKLLDGSVTNEQELEQAISKINKVLLTDNWSYLKLECSTYWMGTWQLDSKGMLTFSFKDSSIIPSWSKDEQASKYIK